jgi:hypothetical protein
MTTTTDVITVPVGKICTYTRESYKRNHNQRDPTDDGLHAEEVLTPDGKINGFQVGFVGQFWLNFARLAIVDVVLMVLFLPD